MNARPHVRKPIQSALLAALFLVSVFAPLGACGSSPTTAPPSGAKIGACLSLTGPTPYWSTQIKRGLDLAADDARAADASAPTIVYEDNAGDPKQAVTAFQKLVDVDHVAAVVTAHTPIAKAERPLAGQLQVPLLGTVVSAVDFGLENEWSFLDWPSHQMLTPPVAQYSYQTIGARKAATLVVNDAYGTDGAKIFADTFSKLGGQVVASETLDAKDVDLRGQLTKILAEKPDVLYMVARDQGLVNAVKQARQAGYQGPIVGVNAFDDPVVWNGLADLGNGIVFAGVEVDTNSEGAKRFASEYQAKYSQPPDWVAFYGYSIGQYLIGTVRAAGGDRAKIRQALAGLNSDTIRGTLAMNASREVNQKPRLYIRQNGQTVSPGA